MKKLLFLLSAILLFWGYNTALADENCNTFYKVNINIEGNGILKINDSDKSYTNDTSINIKCHNDFIFDVKPDDDYYVKGVFVDGNYLTSNQNNYSIPNISSNTIIKVIFAMDEQDLDNEEIYKTNENSISLYMADLKENFESNLVLKFYIKELTILFDNDFIKNSEDNITLVASEIYKEDLNIKEYKAVKNSIYYEINLYNGESLINDFKGTATIKIPYSKSDKVYVYKVEKDGKISKISSEYKNNIVSFKVNGLGKFALSKEELNELNYIKDIINLNNKQVITIVSAGFIISLLILFIKTKKRK